MNDQEAEKWKTLATNAALINMLQQPDSVFDWEQDHDSFHKTWKDKLPDYASYDESKVNAVMQTASTSPRVQITAMQRSLWDTFKSLVQKAETGFDNLMTMSKVLFWTGIIIVAVTFLIEVIGLFGIKIDWKTLAASGGVLGAVGIGTIISSFVQGSMTKIQDSVGNLAQVEVAFLGFIEQLDRIRSMSPTKTDEIEKLFKIINDSRTATMDDIQMYVEKNEEASIRKELKSIQDRLTKLEPQKP